MLRQCRNLIVFKLVENLFGRRDVVHDQAHVVVVLFGDSSDVFLQLAYSLLALLLAEVEVGECEDCERVLVAPRSTLKELLLELF